MQPKGQISFDVYFAVIFAMLIAQQLYVISEQMTEAPREISIASQEQAIGNNVAAIISSTAALSDGKFTVDYLIPSIFDTNALGPQQCEIDVGETLIKVYYPDKINSLVSTDVPFSRPSFIANDISTKCGEKLTIQKTT